MDQIFDRFERMFRSWVNGAADEVKNLFGSSRSRSSTGDPDFDEAMAELDDFLDRGKTESEARQRARERREREAYNRSGSSYSGSAGRSPSGPPAQVIQAYRTLGLPYGTPFAEVKAAYKRLLMQNHPDRNSATAEQLKRSTEISAQINAAYSIIETWTTTGTLNEN